MNFFGLFDKKDTNDNEEIKKSQNIIKIAITAVIFFVLLFTLFSTDDRSAEQSKIGNFKLFEEEKAVKTKWISDAQDEITTMREEVEKLQTEIKQLKESKKINKEHNHDIKEKKQDTSIKENNQNTRDNLQKYPTSPNNSFDISKYLPENYKEKYANKNSENKNPTYQPSTIIEKEHIENSMDIVNYESNQTQIEEKQVLNIIPTGTILKAVLLNGMDAPTMSQAKDSPLIAHLVVKDLGILPNNFTYDIKECFILAEGYGDLSSERVYMRINNLSCIKENNEHIDMKINGYVAGEDGKIGLKGEVVYKQGAILARSIIAGFVDGLADGFSQVGNTISIVDSGGSVTRREENEVSASNMLKRGVYKGVGNAAEKLAEFYLKLADNVFPVIEIQAGRDVDIVVNKYLEVETLEQKAKK